MNLYVGLNKKQTENIKEDEDKEEKVSSDKRFSLDEDTRLIHVVSVISASLGVSCICDEGDEVIYWGDPTSGPGDALAIIHKDLSVVFQIPNDLKWLLKERIEAVVHWCDRYSVPCTCRYEVTDYDSSVIVHLVS